MEVFTLKNKIKDKHFFFWLSLNDYITYYGDNIKICLMEEIIDDFKRISKN